jgi:iron complex transport system substrate-binding protein
VVAVTKFCHYPPEVLELPKVAGFTDVNYEAVLRRRPDLVILPIDKLANKEELERLGLPVMGLDTRSLDGYLATVSALGAATGHLPEAGKIAADLTSAMERARARAKGRRRPRVLFSVMRAMEGSGRITEITAVGEDGFFNQMLETAGGENVYQGVLPFPTLTREAVMTLNPEIIIDLARNGSGPAALVDWLSLGSAVDAVKNGKVVIFTEESDNVPGPRIHMTITRLSEALFPPEEGEAFSVEPGTAPGAKKGVEAAPEAGKRGVTKTGAETGVEAAPEAGKNEAAEAEAGHEGEGQNA